MNDTNKPAYEPTPEEVWDNRLIDGYPARFYEDCDGYDPDPFRKWDAEGRQWAEDLIADRQAHLAKVQKGRTRKGKQ
jgi:hypothetical protein